jgi:hypothetical protein
MPYDVIVYDNYHDMDPEETYRAATFDKADDALRCCRGRVDEFLQSAMQPSMSAEDLYRQYVSFGEDPVVRALGEPEVAFSAWRYAKQRAEALCGGAGVHAGPGDADAV